MNPSRRHVSLVSPCGPGHLPTGSHHSEQHRRHYRVDNAAAAREHRGGMPSTGSFAPTLLLALPQMVDPNFARWVVLLCEHGSEGATGFVANRPPARRAAAALALHPPVPRDKAPGGM